MLRAKVIRGVRGAACAPRRGGFTLVEISLAMTVLLVALMAMSASTIRTHALRRQNHERAMAQNAIRQISEEIHALADELQAPGAGSWSSDFIAGLSPGGSLGNTFAIGELNAQVGAASVGTITVVLNEAISDDELGVEFGMPRDLDSDGQADNADVTGTALILPIIITARWHGVSGDVEIKHPFYVIGY